MQSKSAETQFEIWHKNGYVVFAGSRGACIEWLDEAEFDDYYDAEDHEVRKAVK